jgi:hypothetical protein
MRTLSSTLLAAQKSSSRLPYVKVDIVDRVAGITRLNWSRLYSGSEPDFHHAAAMPGDGSLVRARVDPVSYQLYRQRVASPGPGSDFSPWTGVCTVSSASGIALASRSSRVLLFYVDTDQRTIRVRESTDYGATFGSAASITTAGATVGWLAAAINDSDSVCLFYSVAGTVYAVKRTGGSWGSPSVWSNSAADILGIGCNYQGDWNLVVCGQDSAGGNKVWTCVYGDGYSQSPGSWSSLAELTAASPGSNVEFRCPYLDFPDVFRLFFVEKYTGTASYSRPYWSHSLATAEYISNLWREPVPFNLSSNYSLAMAHSSTHAWLSTPSGVWRAPLLPASVEVTSDVIGLSALAVPGSGKVQIDLRNDDGRYLAPPFPGNLGSEIQVSFGCRTASSAEVSSGLAYWIEGWTFLSATSHEPQAILRLHASDGWSLLDQWKARRQFAWAAGSKNVFQLLNFVLARAGLEFSSFSNSDALVNHCPAFTINPGESGKTAVLRLLSMMPDALFFRGNCGYVVNPQVSDSSIYSYGTSHAILEAEYAERARQANRVQVFGLPSSVTMTEDWDWEEIDLIYDRLAQLHDINLDTSAEAHARGEAMLRHAAIESEDGYVVVPMNCGQELYDVIEISDALAGLTAAKRRVLSLHHTYDTQKGLYTLKIGLGGV